MSKMMDFRDETDGFQLAISELYRNQNLIDFFFQGWQKERIISVRKCHLKFDKSI